MSQARTTAADSRRPFAPGPVWLAADNSRPVETARTQDTLLTGVAHDLNNSLGIIRLRLDLLLEQLDDDSPTPGSEELLPLRAEFAKILATSAHMDRMLDDLLGLSRTRAGHRLNLVPDSMDLVALAERVIAELLLGVDKPRIQLVTSEPEMIGTWAPWQMERVLRNLLSNAVKYSPDGGEISVRVCRSPRTRPTPSVDTEMSVCLA